ncbi:TetR/AcrR family transcriptional regulator [Actinomyces culturomici]|uniref:TetR/AcrR family transcriptional regulator n=1 Tax=Actinomyces culturomici TaxID=1926276 RepID=UPI000E20C7E7|nr:TetR/AcrR family transcriptional regulator [Actinomyces culturomici]
MAARGITKDAIIDAALAIGDAAGLEAVSMRAVASRLGIQAMSLYHHLANKADLLDALHERLITEMNLPDGAGTDWRDILRGVAAAYRAVALAHPRLFVLLATRPISTPASFAHISPALRVLDAEGIAPDVQFFAIEVFFTSLNGYLLAEVGPVPGHPDLLNPAMPTIGEDAPAMLRLLRELDEAGRGDHYFADTFDAYVEVLIGGLAPLVDGAQS